MLGRPSSRLSRWLVAAVVLGLAVLVRRSETRRPGADDEAPRVAQLFEDGRSGVFVSVEGVVERVLPPDDDGSPHQRFIVRLSTDQTLLVAHNLELAPAVPLEVGDRLRVRGEYEWNDRGGVLHWTHDDPAGDRTGGWIEHRGTLYR